MTTLSLDVISCGAGFFLFNKAQQPMRLRLVR